MRDSILFGNGLYGKFFYCESWQEIFSRVKQSILSGEADNALIKFGHDPDRMKAVVEKRLVDGISAGKTHMRQPVPQIQHMPREVDLRAPDMG